jgi:hypothetical protein
VQQRHDLPILGATGPSGGNGGGNLAAIDKLYAVALCTTDGEEHILTLRFNRPTAGPDGVVDFGALKGFDPKVQAMTSVARDIHAAHFGIELGLDPKAIPVVEVVEGGAAVVWRHVTSFEYVGEWDQALGLPVVYDESHERKAAA